MLLRALLVLVPFVALGQTPATEEVSPPAGAVPAEQPAPPTEVAAPAADPELAVPKGCQRWKAEGLGEGPIGLGYGLGDVATGRRACPRTEVGLGGRFGAIIDTPNFYGNLQVDGLVFGSVAIDPKTELFGTLEFIEYNWVQNASLKGSTISVGTLTLGATRQFYGNDRFLGAFSGRLLLPTSQVIPNSWLVGFEVGHSASWRPQDWLEVHSYLGVDFDTGLGDGPTLPRIGGVVTAGVQISPLSFAALVIDATGRLGRLRFFAPTVALRFRVFRIGIELAATVPLIGTDQHDFIVGARFSFRI